MSKNRTSASVMKHPATNGMFASKFNAIAAPMT